MFDELGVASQPTTMSFARAGRAQRPGIQRHRLQQRCSASAATWCRRASGGMVRDILRFYREAPALLTLAGDGPSLGDYLRDNRLLADVHRRPPGADGVGAVVVAIATASWTSRPSTWSRFMANHHMLQVAGPAAVARGHAAARPATCRRLQAAWSVKVRLSVAGARVRRDADGAHRDHRPAATSTSTRSCWPATATRHWRCWPTPATPSARCWARSPTRPTTPCCTPTPASCPRTARPGRRGTPCAGRTAARPCTVSYLMNLLQGLDSPEPFVVTLNRSKRHRPGEGAGAHALPPSGLHPRQRRGAGAARRDQRRQPHLVRRRLLGLRLPRGRPAQRHRGRPRRWARRGPEQSAIYEGCGPAPPAMSPARARLPLPHVPAVPGPGRARPGVRGPLAVVGGPAATWRSSAAATISAIRRCRSTPRCATASSSRTGPRPTGPIRLLTHWRYFGKCYQSGELLLLLRRRRRHPGLDRRRDHQHALGRAPRLRAAGVRRAERRGDAPAWGFDKAFHVSPFMPMERALRTGASRCPANTLRVHMDVLAGDAQGSNSTPPWCCERRPLDAHTLASCLARYPLHDRARSRWPSTGRPLRLWLKRDPVPRPPRRAHPEQSHDEQHPPTPWQPHRGRPRVRRPRPRPAQAPAGQLTHCARPAGAVDGDRARRPGHGHRGRARCRADRAMDIQDPGFYRAMAANGSVGAGEAYMDGPVDCDDLVGLVRILVRNRDRLDAHGNRPGAPRRLGHARAARAQPQHAHGQPAQHRRALRPGQRLVRAVPRRHPDVLRRRSSPTPSESLEAAQRRKLERICRKLDLQPSDHVVEIGTGWGGFALYAAQHLRLPCHHHHHLAGAARPGQRARRPAPDCRTRSPCCSRTTATSRARYDKLVSIEMIEAIGHQYLDTYFAKARACSSTTALALIQAITIEDSRYEQALSSVDFIKRYIFPGSFIPSVSGHAPARRRAASDLRLVNLEDIGPSYALTLQRTGASASSRASTQVRALGYDERFIRMWEFYLCYCEGGFLERSIGDVHLLLARAGQPAPAVHPGTRGEPGEAQSTILVGNVVRLPGRSGWPASPAPAHGYWLGRPVVAAAVRGRHADFRRHWPGPTCACWLSPCRSAGLLDTAFAAARAGCAMPSRCRACTLAPIWILVAVGGFRADPEPLDGLPARVRGLAAMFGLIGGPLAYWTPQRAFDAVELRRARGLGASAALAIGWARRCCRCCTALDQRLSGAASRARLAT